MIIAVIISSILRVVAATSIFISPAFASISSLLLDSVDGYIFAGTGISYETYTLIDKSLDFFWYILILIYVINHRSDIPAFGYFLGLFIIRFIGMALYLGFGNRIFFTFFPNVFEIFFWIYLISKKFGWPNLEKTPTVLAVIAFLFIIKIPQEYLVHVKNFSSTNWLFQLILKKDFPIFRGWQH